MSTMRSLFVMIILLAVAMYLLFADMYTPVFRASILHRRLLHTKLSLQKTRNIGFTNFVLAFAQNYPPDSVAHFVDTFARTHLASSHLVLFVSDVVMYQSRWKHRNVHFQHIVGSGNPIFTRFRTYYAFVRQNNTGAVMMVDARDLFFQGDVFAPHIQPGVHFFAENYTMDYVPNWNVPWVTECALGGSAMAQQMIESKMPIVNGGAVLCSNRSFALQFLSAMSKAIDSNCNDQGYMDILAFTQPFGSNYTHVHLMQLDSWVAHGLQWPEASDVGLLQDSAGRVYSPRGILFAAVHQVDRNPRLRPIWDLRLKPYAAERNVTELRPLKF